MTPEQARAVHHDTFVFDGHNDVAGPLQRGESLDDRNGRGHLDLVRMRQGGLDGGIFAVFIDPDPACGDPLERTREGVRHLRETLETHPDVRLILSAADARAAGAAAREAGSEVAGGPGHEAPIAALIGVEGGYAIDDDLTVADELFEAGVRCLTLTWNDPTTWADAAGPAGANSEPGPHGGLTAFGRKLVDRLQHLGILIDLSHASDDTARDVLARAERPLVASHSGMRRLAPLPRNLPDELLEAIAATGGLVGVSFFNGHLDADFEARCAPLRERRFDDTEALARAVLAEVGTLPLSRLVDHVRHAAAVAGSDHVGLGSDFDGMWAPPAGLEDASQLPALSAGLAEAGVFDERGLTAFLGANWTRVLASALP
ncbi:MAG TPA: membrane dipeptidase [Gemmatimonadota bacterium]|nr:membrane dipeptidase [Gemmatimonadota bacterium]